MKKSGNHFASSTPDAEGGVVKVKPKTLHPQRLTQGEVRTGRLLALPVIGAKRPAVRGDCIDAPRPCPWVSCRYHLALEVNPRTGSLRLNHPGLELEDLPQTCALDVADAGGLSLWDVGQILNLTDERVRQLEERALGRLHRFREENR